MAFAAGVASVVGFQSNTAQLSATAATGASGAVTYQWYRSTSSGFTPGGGNIISGATSLSLSDSGLIPQTAYYYKLQATDAGGPTTVTYTEVSLTTTPQQLLQNQFAPSPVVGQVDQPYSYNTHGVVLDSSVSSPIYAGTAVKIVDSAGGTPKVVACDDDTDDVFGFVNFDVKTVGYTALNSAEISQGGNVMWLYATAAVARGAAVQLDTSSPGCVAPLTASSGADVVGWAYDKASSAGQIIRVFLTVKNAASSTKA